MRFMRCEAFDALVLRQRKRARNIINSQIAVPQSSRQAIIRTTIAYGLMILGAIAAFLLIRRQGETLNAGPSSQVTSLVPTQAAQGNALLHVLIALAAVIVTGLILARLFAYLGQPPVIGEVVAGIVLGPSLLGANISALILPPTVAPFLSVIAQLGVILYMFIIGLEVNADLLKRRAHATVIISHASILAPFVLGAWLALSLYPQFSSTRVTFTSFALFMGVAMSITAFPVLARILVDMRLVRTELGMWALGCAAINDVTAWCLLAFVVGVTQAQGGQGLIVAAEAVVYSALMFLLVRPIMNRLVTRWNTDQLPRIAIAFVLIALLTSSLATETIGIHAIFGAFILGAMIPHESAVARAFTQQMEPLITVLFLPAFFAFTGMRTRLDLVSGLDQWMICGVIILLATAGKFGGTFIAARFTGSDWRNAAALGTLMNTRGLMELIVLNVGLDLKVISPTLFAMMVLMALVTTMTTGPVLRWLIPRVKTE